MYYASCHTIALINYLRCGYSSVNEACHLFIVMNWPDIFVFDFFLQLGNTLHVLRLDQTHRLDMHSERERTIKMNRFLLCSHSNSIHCAHDIHCPSATFTSCDSPPVESPSQWFFEGRLHSSFVCRFC